MQLIPHKSHVLALGTSLLLLTALQASASETDASETTVISVLEEPNVTLYIDEASEDTLSFPASAFVDMTDELGFESSLWMDTKCHVSLVREKFWCDNLGWTSVEVSGTKGGPATAEANLTDFTDLGALGYLYVTENPDYGVGIQPEPGTPCTAWNRFFSREDCTTDVAGNVFCCTELCWSSCTEDGVWGEPECDGPYQPCRSVPSDDLDDAETEGDDI